MVYRKGMLEMKSFWKKFGKNKLAVIGLIVFIIYIFLALFADVFFDESQINSQNYGSVLQTPGISHIFGTDDLGRDLFVRMVYGTRVSMTIGFASTIAGMLIGCLIGASCAYFGGAFDNIIMRCLDVVNCIPFILLAMLIVAVLGGSMINLIIAVTVAGIPGYAKITRGAVLSISEQEYVRAAKACGTRSMKIIVKHILPNAMSLLVVEAAFSVASAMLVASGLSFLGLGVQPPTPEWGSILSSGRQFIRTNPHMILIPGAVIALATVSITWLGDGLRDALDPKSVG
jgi:peptide/nickel transport system permease protein